MRAPNATADTESEAAGAVVRPIAPHSRDPNSASVAELADAASNSTREINEMNSTEGPGDSDPRAHESIFVKRRRRRRLDFRTVDGSLRESTRAYLEFDESIKAAKTPAEKAAICAVFRERSMHIKRHCDTLAGVEMKRLVADIQTQLTELRTPHAVPTALPQFADVPGDLGSDLPHLGTVSE